jgi:hypothetical protein
MNAENADLSSKPENLKGLEFMTEPKIKLTHMVKAAG